MRRSLEELKTRLSLDRSPSELQESSSSPSPPPTPPDIPPFEDKHLALLRLLALDSDEEYPTRREAERQDLIHRLAGFAPAGAPPEEMSGYVNEAALRFAETIRWVADVAESKDGGPDFSVLETGSNPYFLTALLKERFPLAVHMGLNYFGDPTEVGKLGAQAVVDPRGRLADSTYLYADIERHALDAIGPFDVCLFCEVIEHLPFDPAWALSNLACRLRDRGCMILTTPNPARLENIQRLAFHEGPIGDQISGYGIHGRHNREYTMSELLDLLTGTGLVPIRSRTLDVVPTRWSRSAEARGFGQYLMVAARLEGPPRLYRPAWLYRSFSPDQLAQSLPLVESGHGE
jgi:hypothetical protein